MPAGDQQYYVVAVDRASDGSLRDGDKSAYVTIPATDQPPDSPMATVTGLRLTTNSTKLSWSQTSDPDAGDSVQFYRIYRDGTDWINDYYGRTTSGSDTTFTDTATGGDTHTYYIVAVDQSFVESRPMTGYLK
jgi:hypothetical protein